MTAPDLAELRAQLEDHEGLRLRPYLDCCGKYWRECTCREKGKLSIGIGRNLDDRGITEDESRILCDNDITDTIRALSKRLAFFDDLDPIRQRVLIDMGFNIGVPGLMLFRHMLAACGRRDFKRAAKEMRTSLWYDQVQPSRRDRLIHMMEHGEA